MFCLQENRRSPFYCAKRAADVKRLLKRLSLFTRGATDGRRIGKGGYSRRGLSSKIQQRLLRCHRIINRAGAIDAERIPLKRIPTYITPIAAVRRGEGVVVNHSILFTRTGKGDNSWGGLPRVWSNHPLVTTVSSVLSRDLSFPLFHQSLPFPLLSRSFGHALSSQ